MKPKPTHHNSGNFAAPPSMSSSLKKDHASLASWRFFFTNIGGSDKIDDMCIQHNWGIVTKTNIRCDSAYSVHNCKSSVSNCISISNMIYKYKKCIYIYEYNYGGSVIKSHAVRCMVLWWLVTTDSHAQRTGTLWIIVHPYNQHIWKCV